MRRRHLLATAFDKYRPVGMLGSMMRQSRTVAVTARNLGRRSNRAAMARPRFSWVASARARNDGSHSTSEHACCRRLRRMTNSRYRWVIVAAGGLLGCVAIGSMFSLPVLLQAHRSGHRLVGDRRVERHDHRLSRHGLRQHGLGQPLRSARAARGGLDRGDRSSPRALRSRPKRHRFSRSSWSSVSSSAGARRPSSRR